MVNLPIERIWKPQKSKTVAHINDAVIDASLANEVKKGIGPSPVKGTPFYDTDVWRYKYSSVSEAQPAPNLSKQGLPKGIHEALAAEKALTAANDLTTEAFCMILRNALAHGGILYLDENGQTAEGKPVKGFCFVSTKQNNRNVVGLNFLQVKMKDYRDFLTKWVNWLQGGGSVSACHGFIEKRPRYTPLFDYSTPAQGITPITGPCRCSKAA